MGTDRDKTTAKMVVSIINAEHRVVHPRRGYVQCYIGFLYFDRKRDWNTKEEKDTDESWDGQR